jgi:hypothetical protein
MPLFMDVHGHIEEHIKHELTPQQHKTMRRILVLACAMTHAMAFTVSTAQPALAGTCLLLPVPVDKKAD